MSHHGCHPIRGTQAFAERGQQRPGRFARLFGELPALYTDPAVLRALGDRIMRETPDNAANRSESYPLGYVFLGQFIDHDITLDVTSGLDQINDPNAVANFRTPALDLDNLYGIEPEASPHLYQKDRPGYLLIGEGGNDLPRSSDGVALIGDPRNDENRIVSQLQLAYLKFHNAIMDHLHEADFEEARRLARWHYQWLVVNQFLTLTCGEDVVADILHHGRRFYHSDTGRGFIPVEFAVGAYRYGHSQVPSVLSLNGDATDLKFFGRVLGGGFAPVTEQRETVDWSYFFPVGGGSATQNAQRIDTRIADELLDLPFFGPEVEERSLATRNLLRGQSFGLPAGQTLAEAMGEEPLSAEQIGTETEIDEATPLWYYVLREAELLGQRGSSTGERLGPVGGRLVAETIIGLIELDETSYLGADRSWRPELPRADGTTDRNAPFGIGDVLAFAGVVH